MRAFGVLGNLPVSKWSHSGVLLPGLLVLHAVLAATAVVWGRSGFEFVLGLPGGRAIVLVLAAVAIAGLGRGLADASAPEERLVAGFGLLFPLGWLAAISTNMDYDGIAATFSATAFGEQGDAFWFPGVPFVALGFACALFAYTWTCELWASRFFGARCQRIRSWVFWSLWAVSLAGVVHWATGW